jgi:hypothetical protein
MAGSAKGRAIWKFGVAAALGAAIVNLVILVAASAAGVEFFAPDPRTGNLTEIGAPQVIFVTLFSSLIGLAVAAIAERLDRPLRWVQIGGVVATLLSLVSPLALDEELATRLALSLMHLIAGAAFVGALGRADRVGGPPTAT